MKPKSKISEDLKSSILSSEATSLAKEYTEIALDSLLNDGIFKEIPVIGSVVGLFKIGSSIKEKHAIRKIATFLNSLEDIPDVEKEKFLKRLDDEDKNGELFERLLLILDRLDETIKAEIIGNLFRIYIMGALDKMMFLRCASVVEQAFVSDLIALYDQYYYYSGASKVEDERFVEYSEMRSGKITEQNLTNLGLMEMELKVSKTNSRLTSDDYEIKTKWKLNAIGVSLSTFMFYNINDDEFKKHMEWRKADLERVK